VTRVLQQFRKRASFGAPRTFFGVAAYRRSKKERKIYIIWKNIIKGRSYVWLTLADAVGAMCFTRVVENNDFLKGCFLSLVDRRIIINKMKRQDVLHSKILNFLLELQKPSLFCFYFNSGKIPDKCKGIT